MAAGDATTARTARDRLRRLLATEGILWAGPDQPITGRDGSTAPWMLYTPQISLTGKGLRLAAACLLERLADFRSTQLAAYGYTGLPLVAGCVALGDGRHSGLTIREERKRHGANRRIDGPADRSRPVVVIDDSLSSGRALRGAIRALEEDGFEVEGTVSLVHFPYRGGAEWARAYGYRVETLFDIWDDLEMPRPTPTPAFSRIRPTWGEDRVPDGLHPAAAARWIARHYLRTGTAPLPPARFAEEHAGPGGVYVSFRDRRTGWRLARDGFWHFDPADADPLRDLVLATVKTVRSASAVLTLDRLKELKIAVSFLGPLTPATPSELDFDRYGIVVRSAYWPTKAGGALPNTQVFTSELEQLRHARVVNAQIGEAEPHELFIHDIEKCVEPGASWPPYGAAEEAAWRSDPRAGERLAARAWAAIGHEASAPPVPDALAGAPVDAVGVTLYAQGAVGCGVAWRKESLDAALVAAARHAARDDRYVPDPAARATAVVVTLMHDREWLGDASVERVGRKMRHGLDALSVHQGDRHAVYLDSVVPHFNWTTTEAARQLLGKAGIEGGRKDWFTYRATSWLGDKPLAYGFPRRRQPSVDDAYEAETLALLCEHLVRGQDVTGLPHYERHPVSGAETRRGTMARLCHALGALGAAGRMRDEPRWRGAAARGVHYCLRHIDGARGVAPPGQRASRIGDLSLLEAVVLSGATPPDAPALLALAAGLRDLFRPDGRVADDAAQPVRHLQDHDFLPGVALHAFAQAAAAAGEPVFELDWEPHFAFYERRWREIRGWGLTAWQLQAWSAIHRLTGRERYADLVLRMADWAVDGQLAKNGAFLTALSPHGPSFHAAFIAEGIADAWGLAAALGDERRAARYERSWRQAIAFMDALVVRAEDTYCMRDPERALGGVRGMLGSSDCRVDYASHLAMALVKGRLARGA